MLNAIKEIYNWQVAAGNAAKPYDDFLESSFQIEEALEGFSDLPHLASKVLAKDADTGYEAYTPKDVSRAIVSLARMDGEVTEHLADVDRLDKACDAIVFAIGSMAKLGLDHHAITKALNIVNEANKQKLNSKRDSLGKLEKPVDFKGPEEKLQELLDRYKSGK